jgi:hypothetical protein
MAPGLSGFFRDFPLSSSSQIDRYLQNSPFKMNQPSFVPISDVSQNE